MLIYMSPVTTEELPTTKRLQCCRPEPGVSRFNRIPYFGAGIKIEQEYDIKTTQMHISLGDLLEMDHFEEKEIFEIIKDTQIDTSKGVKMVDVKSKYHLKVLQKSGSKTTTIFGGITG